MMMVLLKCYGYMCVCMILVSLNKTRKKWWNKNKETKKKYSPKNNVDACTHLYIFFCFFSTQNTAWIFIEYCEWTYIVLFAICQYEKEIKIELKKQKKKINKTSNEDVVDEESKSRQKIKKKERKL